MMFSSWLTILDQFEFRLEHLFFLTDKLIVRYNRIKDLNKKTLSLVGNFRIGRWDIILFQKFVLCVIG